MKTIRSPDPTPALVKPSQLTLKDKTPHKTPGLKSPGKLPDAIPKSPAHLAPDPKTPGPKSPSKSMLGASPLKSPMKSPSKTPAKTPQRSAKTPGDEGKIF